MGLYQDVWFKPSGYQWSLVICQQGSFMVCLGSLELQYSCLDGVSFSFFETLLCHERWKYWYAFAKR